MKMTIPNICVIVTLLALSVTSCKQQQKPEEDNGQQSATEIVPQAEQPKITLELLDQSPVYADAVLQLKTPANTSNIKEGAIDFDFTVDKYEFGAQTAGPNPQRLANSGKGQHIHFILNNQPYSAHYEGTFKKEIPNGVHHLVAFLSRSYHESVKNENSVVVKKLEVGPNAKDTIGVDIEAPTLIYSRPKGTYAGKDAEQVLLDFFVLNTKLSASGHKVKAVINGEEFIITQWAPHIIKGLPKGEITIQLALIDEAGNPISGPFNNVTRMVTVTE